MTAFYLGRLPGTFVAPAAFGVSVLSIRGFTTIASVRGINCACA